MRIAYLDCFAGIAGDMFLGALLDSGVPAEVMHDAIAALNIGAALRIEKVDRSGITSTKVSVLEQEQRATVAEPSRDRQDNHAEKRVEEQADREARTWLPQTQNLHKAGHNHHHNNEAQEHPHHHHNEAHGRSLTEIRNLIEAAPLHDAVKALAIRAFELLGASEAKIHNVPVERIHFHEVGAVDAIVDIVATSAGIHALGVEAWHCSPVNVGGGTVNCAHGTFPVPAPATADLLRGCPTYSAHVQKELVTPTGAALLKVLNPIFGEQPMMQVASIGYGAGTRNPDGFPNVLRLSIGESAQTSRAANVHSRTSSCSAESEDIVSVLETALDDVSPQVLAFAMEKALTEGALDVMFTPVTMKKGRLGTLLTLLCDPALEQSMKQLLLRETSTLGVRIRQERRAILRRESVAVETQFGTIRVKVASLAGEERKAMPEFEDCRRAASTHGVSIKAVQDSASAAYLAL